MNIVANFRMKNLLFVAVALLFLSPIFFPSFASAATLQRAPNNLGLVGYWAMDEGAGNITGDGSGRGNKGTLTNFALSGATSNWVAGKHGKALDMDGTNDYVYLGASTPSSFPVGSAARTVSVWVNMTTVSVNQTFMMYGIASGGGGGKMNLFYFNTSGGVTVAFFGNDYNSNIIPTRNTWQHWMFTYDGATTLKMYRDGVEVYSNTGIIAPGTEAGTLNYLGYYNGGAAWNLQGKMDDVRLYNRALSTAQVAALYQSGQVTRKSVSNQGLVGYWALNEGRGNIAGDSSGNANTGSLGSAVAWVTGKKGGALSFNGNTTNSVVDLTNNTINLANYSSFSISTWVKIPSLWSAMSPNFPSYMGHANSWGFYGEKSDNKIYFFLDNGSGVRRSVTANNASVANTWIHTLVTCDGTTLRLYIDSVLQSTTASCTGGFENVAGLYSLGKSDTSSNFAGSLDDARIYNRALSATEVAALYRQNETKLNTSQNNKITNGLVGLWSFDGADYDLGSATAEALDRSGQGNNGDAVNGPLPTAGKVGQGLKFDGVDDYLNMGDDSDFDFGTGNFTASVWVYGGALKDSILVKDTYSGGNNGIYLYTKTSSLIYAYWNGTTEYDFGPVTNAWHHLVAVRSSTGTGGVALYYDGVAVAGTFTDSRTLSNAIPLYVGSDQNLFSDTFFTGKLDEVRLYNRALSVSEVKQLYNLGK